MSTFNMNQGKKNTNNKDENVHYSKRGIKCVYPRSGSFFMQFCATKNLENAIQY